MNKSKLYHIAKEYEDKELFDKAYQFYLEAVLSEHDADAMYSLGMMYHNGEYVHSNYIKAGRYFGLAYDNGATMEAWTLIIAGSYWERKARENDDNIALENAIKYYQKAVEHGVRYGSECLGKIYYELGEYNKAYEHLVQIDERSACGLYYMGKMYDEGKVVKKNTKNAISYYIKAVEVGSLYAEEYGEDMHTALARERLQAMA